MVVLSPMLTCLIDRDYKGFVDAPSNGDSPLEILDRAAPSKGSTDDPQFDAKSQNALSGDSNNGSPPRTMTGGALKSTQSNLSEYYPANEHASSPSTPNKQWSPPGAQQHPQQQPPTSRPPGSPHHNNQRQQQGRGGTRTASKGGGVQVVLDEQGSWADLGNKESRISNGDERNSRSGSSTTGSSKPNGMLGFLSRKKGRQRSPKPMEAGVLGKEGARVVVGGR